MPTLAPSSQGPNLCVTKDSWLTHCHSFAHTCPLPVHGVGAANTFAVYGNGIDKELTELVPGILSQLGPDSLASLRKLAESYQAMNAAHMANQQGAGADAADEVPDVVSTRRTVRRNPP